MALQRITKKLDEGHVYLTFTVASSSQSETGEYVIKWGASRPVTAVGLNSHFPSSVFTDFKTESIDFRTSPQTSYEWGYEQVSGSDDSYYVFFTETTSTPPSSETKSVNFFFQPTVSAVPKSAAAMRQYYQIDGVGQFGGNGFPENTNIETSYSDKYQGFTGGVPYMDTNQSKKLWDGTFGAYTTLQNKYNNFWEIDYETLLLFNRSAYYTGTLDLPPGTYAIHISESSNYYEILDQYNNKEVGRIGITAHCLVALMQAGGGGGAGCFYPNLSALSGFIGGGGGGSGENMCIVIYLQSFFIKNPEGIIWFKVGEKGKGGTHYRGVPTASLPNTILGSAGSPTKMYLSTDGDWDNPLAICYGGGGGGSNSEGTIIPYTPGAGADMSKFSYKGEYISLLKKNGISSSKDFINAGVSGGKGRETSNPPIAGGDYEASKISFIDDLAMAAQKGGQCSKDGSYNIYAGGGGGASLLGAGGARYYGSSNWVDLGAGGAGGAVHSNTAAGGLTDGQDGGDGVVRLWWPQW